MQRKWSLLSIWTGIWSDETVSSWNPKPLENPLKEFKLKPTSGPFFSLLNDLSSRVESNRLKVYCTLPTWDLFHFITWFLYGNILTNLSTHKVTLDWVQVQTHCGFVYHLVDISGPIQTPWFVNLCVLAT